MSLEQIFYRFCKINNYYKIFTKVTRLKFNEDFYKGNCYFSKSCFYYGFDNLIRPYNKKTKDLKRRWQYFIVNCIFLDKSSIKNGDFVTVQTPKGEFTFKCKIINSLFISDEVTKCLHSAFRIKKINGEERKPSWFIKYKRKVYGID